MNVNGLINFNYNQNPAFSFNIPQPYSSQHIISTAKVLRFTYQRPEPLPQVYRLVSFPSKTFEAAAQPLSQRPSQQGSSNTTTKKLNLVSTKHRRQKIKSTAFPQCTNKQLQQDQLNHVKKRSLNESFHEEKESKIKSNPQSIYTYNLPNHISLQLNEKATCEIFTACKDNERQIENEFKEKDQKNGKSTANTQEVRVSQKETKNLTRQRIFEPKVISHFIVRQALKQNQQQKVAETIQEVIFRTQGKFQSRQTQRKQINRATLFQSFPLQEHRMCRAVQEEIQIQDIPEAILSKWQTIKPQIRQYQAENESNCWPSSFS